MAYIALGSNLGDREEYLSTARAAIAALPGTTIVTQSSIEETAPIGPAGQDNYLNQMLAVNTNLPPHDLLHSLQQIEYANGRVRGCERWTARTLDIDIVLYGDGSVMTDDLKIPHPELPNRDFWQRELLELDVNVREHVR